MENPAEVKIMREYDGKIVYTTDIETDAGPLRADCERRGGEFDECGDICPPGAEMCAQVCAYTCEYGESEAGPALPQGFGIYKVVGGLPGAGDFAGPDRLGNFWVARPGSGAVTLISNDEKGDVEHISNVLEDLDEPEALVLAPGERMNLYYAHSGALHRAKLYTDAAPERLHTLPAGSAATSFGLDGRLYVHAGGKVSVLNEAGELEPYAPGPAGAGGMAVDPVFGGIWAAGANGVYTLERGSVEFKAELPKNCGRASIDFVPEEGWPAESALDLLAACPDSGEVLRIDLSDSRRVERVSVFMVFGRRPADMALMPGGIMRVTDSMNGELIMIGAVQASDKVASGPRVDGYEPGMKVESPWKVTGRAPGTWFFEGSFTVRLVNDKGETVAEAPARAQGDWMTEGRVRFETELRFNAPGTARGFMVLEKANPSGLKENEKKVRLEVKYKRQG
jgi:hypothetical protein